VGRVVLFPRQLKFEKELMNNAKRNYRKRKSNPPKGNSNPPKGDPDHPERIG